MIRCFVLDDEQHAIDELKDCIEQTPFLSLAGTAKSGYDVLNILSHNTIDLLFMDIQMPEITGIEMLKLVSVPVILTTAYPEYAVHGYEHDVIDYLLKPFSYTRFLKAAQKANLHFNNRSNVAPASITKDYFFIRGEHKGKQRKINYILTHVLRIVFVVFKPRFLSKFPFISRENFKPGQLVIYYFITVVFLLIGLFIKLGYFSIIKL